LLVLFFYLVLKLKDDKEAMKVLSIPVGTGGTKGLARLLAHVGGSNSIHMRNEMKGKP
jgi:hypothetical protein